jgi:uncharacterized membrane-anchored protein YhcB (DUF1043 family)
MAVELVIGIALISLLAGVGVGYLFTRASSVEKARVAELDGALEAAKTELADYKRDVFGQFSETAEKFRALDKSYNDLHRQLAESSLALCGDAATPLLEGYKLEGPLAPAIERAEEEIVVAEAEVETEAEAEVEVETEAPMVNEDIDTVPILTELEAEPSFPAEDSEQNPEKKSARYAGDPI